MARRGEKSLESFFDMIIFFPFLQLKRYTFSESNQKAFFLFGKDKQDNFPAQENSSYNFTCHFSLTINTQIIIFYVTIFQVSRIKSNYHTIMWLMHILLNHDM